MAYNICALLFINTIVIVILALVLRVIPACRKVPQRWLLPVIHAALAILTLASPDHYFIWPLLVPGVNYDVVSDTRWITLLSNAPAIVRTSMIRIWFLIATLQYWIIGSVIDRVVTKFVLRRGYCPNCDYDIRASGNRCPECGASLIKHHRLGGLRTLP